MRALFSTPFVLSIDADVLRSDAEALGLLDADRNAMFAEPIDRILRSVVTGAGRSKAKFDVRRRTTCLMPSKRLKPFREAASAHRRNPTAHAKGSCASTIRGLPIPSHFLHPNCLRRQWSNGWCMGGGHELRITGAIWSIASDNAVLGQTGSAGRRLPDRGRDAIFAAHHRRAASRAR